MFTIPARFSFLRFAVILMLSHLSYVARTQLCSGSLGDPVVNITFGGAGGSNPAYAPSNVYTYTSDRCPNDGFYTITTTSTNCFGNSWHNVTADHTGGGAYMLVNASYEPGDFFLTTVSDLCPNTTYEFAAWVMNVMKASGIEPNITFRIEQPDGTILGEYATGNVPETGSPQWKQYGLYFTTPADNATVILRITNNAPGGIGNDLALDDITFRPCGPLVTIAIPGQDDEINICEGDPANYTFNADVSSAYIEPAFQWQVSENEGSTWEDISEATSLDFYRAPTAAGIYWYRLTVVEENAVRLKACRIASANNIIINVRPIPQVDAGPDRIVLADSSIILHATAEGENLSYLWTPSNFLSTTNELNPQASPIQDIVYTLRAESPYGCYNSDEVMVKVIHGIYAPTAFTPNNDGLNDTWRVQYLDPEWKPVASIYNRHGQLVYQQEGIDISWDGRFKGVRQDAGVYAYVVTLRLYGLMLKGTLTLIR